MKKLIIMMLALALTFGLSIGAFAGGTGTVNVTSTIQGFVFFCGQTGGAPNGTFTFIPGPAGDLVPGQLPVEAPIQFTVVGNVPVYNLNVSFGGLSGLVTGATINYTPFMTFLAGPSGSVGASGLTGTGGYNLPSGDLYDIHAKITGAAPQYPPADTYNDVITVALTP